MTMPVIAPPMPPTPRDAMSSAAGWTFDTYAIYNEALRVADLRFSDERDRRYTEIAVEKEKALKIKETADLAALSLARDSQTYKEQQNDALRDKNLSESGVYATNASVAQAIGDLATRLQPLFDYVQNERGAATATQTIRGNRVALYAIGATLLVGLGAMVLKLLGGA